MPAMERARALARRISAAALNAVLPPLCLSCESEVDEPGSLCARCWSKVSWIAPPLCACCGAPFEFDPGGGGLMCGDCARERPAFDRARAAFRYDEASRDLILAFKHADRTDRAPAFGRWLARAGSELLAVADFVVPVPLHWSRLALRRYNQAAMLAQATARASGRPYLADLLVRRRRTPSQGRLDRSERRRNVRRAFALNPRHAAKVAGARIVLVDDVFTTGSTVSECTATLLAGGAAAVDVLTLARVVRPG